VAAILNRERLCLREICLFTIQNGCYIKVFDLKGIIVLTSCLILTSKLFCFATNITTTLLLVRKSVTQICSKVLPLDIFGKLGILLRGFRDVMFWIKFETPVNLFMLLLKYLPKQKANAQLIFMIFLGLLV